MIGVAWHWRHMSPAQREAALKDLAGCGRDGKGEPPSGPEGVVWLETPQGWRWRGGIFPFDLEHGIRIGVPAGADDLDADHVRGLTAALAGKPRPEGALLQTAYVVTPAEAAPAAATMRSLAGVTLGLSRGPAPKAKPKKRRR